MQDIEDLVRGGDHQRLLDATAAWSDKQKRAAQAWLAEYWSAEAEAIEAAFAQNGDSTRWMHALIAVVATARTPKQALALRPPGSRTTGVAEWDAVCDLYAARGEAKAALVNAVARNGRDWTQAYLKLLIGGKRKKPMYADVLLALMKGFGLDSPDEAFMIEAWARSFSTLMPYRLPEDPPAPFVRKVSRLWLDNNSDGHDGRDGHWLAHGEEIDAPSSVDVAAALFGLKDMVRAVFLHKDAVMHLIGGWLVAERSDHASRTLAGLLKAGFLDRRTVAEDAVTALTRNDSVSAQRLLARLLLAVEPSPQLIAPLADTLCGVMASAHGSAAECAQTLLQRLDAVEPLDEDLFVNACQIVFARKEKGLRQAQLAWAAKRSQSRPALLAASLSGLAGALMVDDFAFQKDAAARLLKLAGPLATADRDALDARIDSLRAAMDPTIYATLRPTSPDMDADSAPAPAVPFPTTHALAITPQASHAFLPINDASRGVPDAPDGSPLVPGDERLHSIEHIIEFAVRAHNAGISDLSEHMRARLGKPMEAGKRRMLLAVQGRDRMPEPAKYDSDYWHASRVPLAAAAVEMRASEVVEALASGQPYALVSQPSYLHGAITADDLVTRLRRLAATGTTAGPLDLLLALMRTQQPDAARLDALRAVGTAQASSALSFFEAGGMEQLQTQWQCVGGEPVTRYSRPSHWAATGEREVCVTLRPMQQLPDIDGTPTRWGEGFAPEAVQDVWYWDLLERNIVQAMPNNPEAMAAMHLWGFRKAGADFESDGGKAFACSLPLFLAAHGPAGPALHLAVLFCMSANHIEGRLVGSDGLLELIHQGRYDSALACELAAAAIDCGTLKAGRLAASLAQVACAGPQAPVLWPLISASVHAALAKAVPPTNTHDLLALASRVAGSLGIRETIAPLEAVAARKGSTKLLLEARRLQQLLGMA
ncbi:DUF6493 family protein [Variovorax sp. H27-G14]|uniref:DUF6493 family protein n=1 Tax=Variovorax sp. H27-G14 TaxID=3111914 RepID=UPI0038FC5879